MIYISMVGGAVTAADNEETAALQLATILKHQADTILIQARENGEVRETIRVRSVCVVLNQL